MIIQTGVRSTLIQISLERWQSGWSCSSWNRMNLYSLGSNPSLSELIQDRSIFNMNKLSYREWQSHPYHRVSVSPWPLTTSFSLLVMTLSAAAYFNGYANGGIGLALGFLLVLLSRVLWFRDVINERLYEGAHTKMVQKGLSTGFLLFLVSEIFLFLSVFWAFMHSALSPNIELNMEWPPVGIESLDALSIPLLNTVILLVSGASVTWGHHALIKGDIGGAKKGFVWTILLALVFTYFQVVEYSQAEFTITDSVFGSVFFFGTGLHACHIVVGNIFLMVGLARLSLNHSTSHHHVGLEAAILYYHLVDVVWLALYAVFYWWGS